MAKVHSKFRMRVALWFALAIVVAAALLGTFDSIRSTGMDKEAQDLKYGWTVVQNGKVFEDQTVDLYQFPEGELGYLDSITFSHRIVLRGHPPYLLRFKGTHTSVRVALDGATIFQYGEDLLKEKKFLGTGLFSVPIPYDASGKTLSVTFYGGYNLPLDRSNGFELLSKESAYTDYNARHGFGLFIGIFLVVFGFICVVFGLAFYGVSKTSYRVCLIGALSLLVGLWSMCYARVVQICTVDYAMTSFIEYISLYLMPIPFLLLLRDMHRGKISSFKWKVLLGITIYAVLFAAVSIILHCLGILFVTQTIYVFHVSILIASVFCLFSGLPWTLPRRFSPWAS